MKILYVTTVGQTMGFFTAFITELVQQGHAVDIACSGIESVPRQYTELGCKIFRLSCARSPFKFGNLLAIKEIKRIVESGKYNIVHCHTPVAAALTRIACKTLRQKGLKIIYTAHGFHFYKGAPLLNWLSYYPIERFLARFTDVLITINNEDHEIAQTFKAKKVVYVPGVGLNTQKFNTVVAHRKTKHEELGINVEDIVFVSVGELIKRKNHEVAIRALAHTSQKDFVYFICGIGPFEPYLRSLIIKLGMEEKIILLGYRTDIPEIMAASDIFLFPSLQEGLPVALMEAMASGLPVVCSNIRGNSDLIENEKGGYLAAPSEQGFRTAIAMLINNRSRWKEMGEFNKRIIRNFDVGIINMQIREIYSTLLSDSP